MAPERQAGHSMVELLTAMLLLTVVMVGLAGLQLSAIRSVTSVRRADGAVRLAQSMVERYSRAPFADFGAMTLTTWTVPLNQHGAQMAQVDTDGVSRGPFTVEHYIELSGTAYLITVRVSWSEASGTSRVHLTTVRTS